MRPLRWRSSHTPQPDSAAQSLLFNTIFRSDYLYWSVTRMFESSLLAPLGVPAGVQAAMTQDQTSAVGEYLRLMHPVSMRKANPHAGRDPLGAGTVPADRCAAHEPAAFLAVGRARATSVA